MDKREKYDMKPIADVMDKALDKLTGDATVKRVRQMRKLGLSYRKISERIGCNIYTVHDIISSR